MTDFLQQMAVSSAERAANARTFTASDLDRRIVPLPERAFGVIAEIKQRSPAEGALAAIDSDRVARAKQYSAASAISVLTEPLRFDGDLAHLTEVAEASSNVPVMRKDFLVDPVQILEARHAGASGVLLITAMLDDRELRSMLDCAFEHGLFVLLEAFDEDDLDRATRLRASDFDMAERRRLLFGVNTRNLRTLAVDPDRLESLKDKLPVGIAVAESGLKVADDARRVAGWGYSMALVGTALMRADDPAALIREMQDAGAEGVAAC